MGELGLLARELSDSVMAANVRLDTRFAEAIRNKDVEGAVGCFVDSPDLVVVLWGNILRGPAALRQFLNELFSKMQTVNARIDEITRWSAGDMIFAVGTATYDFEANDGTKSSVKECWTDARQKVRGRWVYILDHATQIA